MYVHAYAFFTILPKVLCLGKGDFEFGVNSVRVLDRGAACGACPTRKVRASSSPRGA